MTAVHRLPEDERVELLRLADTRRRVWERHVAGCATCQVGGGCPDGEGYRRIWEDTRDVADPDVPAAGCTRG